MTDREKIISFFEYTVNKAHGEGWDFVDLSTEDAKEILALLKEQEPVKLVEQKGKWFKYLKCGNCHAQIPQNVRPNYCSNCGRAVKWDD